MHLVSAQTGNLITHVDFVKDVQCVTFNVHLTNAQNSLLSYRNVNSGDTLRDIPIGMYDVLFISCDSSYTYSQKIEIAEGKTRNFNYTNTSRIVDTEYDPLSYNNQYYDDYYDTFYKPVFFGAHFQFSRGIDYESLNLDLLNNFAFDYTFGHDILLTKPIALGYEIGFGFTQANFVNTDLVDPQTVHERQRFTTFDFSIAGMTSIYINDSRMLTLGARYRLPYFARYARITGNEKQSTGGLHKYNDLAVFAMLGYDWGHVFAEYRFDQFLKSPLGEIPQLSLGVRLSIMDEW